MSAALPPAPNVPDNDLRRYLRLLRERIVAIEASLDGLQVQQDATSNEVQQGQTGAVTLANQPPEPLAPTAQAGRIDEASRRDHRHPFPTAAEVGADPAGTAAAAVAAHVAAVDPHTQYLTAAEGAAAFDALGAASAAVTAHEAASDPHAQYLTAAEGNAAYVGLTGDQTVAGNKTFSGDLAHTGTNLGLYSATPVPQASAIADASGGATVDAEARTAINAILAAIRAIGLIAT